MTTGEIIRLKRLELGLTQEKLGEMVGVNKAAVQKWESGTVINLKRWKLELLARIFNISIDELLGYEAQQLTDSFQNRLKQAMEQSGIKAAELAKRTGLSKAQISQYVNGVYEAKQNALYKIAVALNVSEAWLMGHEDRYQQPKPTDVIDEQFQEVMALFAQLNQRGKLKVIEMLEDLTMLDSYRKEDE